MDSYREGDAVWDRLCRGFSCPDEPSFDWLIQAINSEHALASVRFFLARFGKALESSGHGLVEFLNAAVESLNAADVGSDSGISTWDPAFSGSYAAARNQRDEQAPAWAARIAIHFMLHGIPGRWKLALDPSERLRWQRVLLPRGDSIVVESDGHNALIQISHEGRSKQITLIRSNGSAWTGTSKDVLPALTLKASEVIVVPKRLFPEEPYEGGFSLPRVAQRWSDPWQRAVDLLRSYANPYLGWIERVLRLIVPMKAAPALRVIRSGSISTLSGVIYGSIHPEPHPLAETLVHECSHQYFYLCSRLGDVDDGSDNEKYYSPVARAYRSLDRIVLAFHAFANVLLFYEMCDRNGIEDANYFERNVRMVKDALNELSRPLAGNGALTPLGHALCVPLLEQLS